MKLFGSPFSPYVRKVRVLLAEKNDSVRIRGRGPVARGQQNSDA